MKVSKLMLAVLAGLAFASCSDDLKNDPGLSRPNESIGSTGFISVAINLPTEAATRGINDDFDDGTDNEYSVKSAAILFFEGDLPNPSFSRVYPVTSAFDEDPELEDDYKQITSSAAATFPVDFAKESNKPLYALAVLNFEGVFNISLDEDSKTYKLGVYENGSTTPTPFTTDKGFEDLMKIVSKAQLWDNANKEVTAPHNFFMTNTPYSRVPGGATEPVLTAPNTFRVLADVLRQNIYETADQAKANPAAEIFVERAVAKVQVKLGENKALSNLTTKLGVTVQSINWVIDNTEPSTYIIRNLEQVGTNYSPNAAPYWANYKSNTNISTNYRFIGGIPLKDLARYRTYFCANPDDNGKGYNYADYYQTDENGNEVLKTGAILPLSLKTNAQVTGELNTPQYCNENTFDVEHMDYFNTTRAVIKVKFASMDVDNPNRPFYTVGLDQTTRYIFSDAASILTRGIVESPKARKIWEDYFKEKYTDEEFAAANTVATTLGMTYTSNNLSSGSGTNEWMEVNMSNVSGRLNITDFKLYDPNKETKTEITVSADDKKAIMNEINDAHVIKTYTNNEGYFAVRIKHFGDTYTRWTEPTEDGKSIDTPTTDEAYRLTADGKETSENNYLGRYGVVRNNWYIITIDAINSFGEPTIGDLPLDRTPDDKTKKEEAIAARINILSWAKREQHEEL